MLDSLPITEGSWLTDIQQGILRPRGSESTCLICGEFMHKMTLFEIDEVGKCQFSYSETFLRSYL